MKRQRQARPALSLLALMMAVGPFGDTEYTPALPAIADSLNTTYDMVLLTMTAYLAGMSVAQLAYGPLSDRFGRRPVAISAAGIMTFGALACLLSFAIWPLIAARLLQGLGAAAGGVIAKAAVRDAFRADERERVYAQMNAAFALAPALGPVIGAIVIHTTVWRVNFLILVLVSAALWLLLWLYFPETLHRTDRRALEPRRIWRNYTRPLFNLHFVYYAVLGGLAIGLVYTALVGGPDLVYNVIGGGTYHIIIVALVILAGYASGAGLCAFLSRHVSDNALVAGGLGMLLCGSLVLLGVGLFIGDRGTLAAYLTPIAFCFSGVGLIVPVSTTNALESFSSTAGAVSSLLGCVRMGVAALGTAAMSSLSLGSVLDIPIVFLGLSTVALVLFFLFNVGRTTGIVTTPGSESRRG